MTLRNRRLTFLDADCTIYGLLPLLTNDPVVHSLHQDCHTLWVTLHDLIKLCKLGGWNVYATSSDMHAIIMSIEREGGRGGGGGGGGGTSIHPRL